MGQKNDKGEIIYSSVNNQFVESHLWSFDGQGTGKNKVIKSPHFHEDYQLGFTIHGGMKNIFRNTEVCIPEKTFYLIPPGFVHKESFADKSSLEFSFVFLSQSMISRVLEECNRVNNGGWCSVDLIFPNPAQNKLLGQYYLAFFASLRSAATELQTESHLIELINQIVVHSAGRISSVPDHADPRAVSAVRDFLRHHYQRKVTLDELSGLAFMSKYHLLRTFRKEVGMSIHQYQMQLKIAQARNWLKAGKPISDISFDLGFNDPSHFTSSFRRHTAQLPKNFK